MVYDLVRTLKIEHIELEKNAAFAVFQVSPRVGGSSLVLCGEYTVRSLRQLQKQLHRLAAATSRHLSFKTPSAPVVA